jgi:hypothetical protein
VVSAEGFGAVPLSCKLWLRDSNPDRCFRTHSVERTDSRPATWDFKQRISGVQEGSVLEIQVLSEESVLGRGVVLISLEHLSSVATPVALPLEADAEAALHLTFMRDSEAFASSSELRKNDVNTDLDFLALEPEDDEPYAWSCEESPWRTAMTSRNASFSSRRVAAV